MGCGVHSSPLNKLPALNLLARWLSALWYFIPLLILSAIWIPELSHYYVPRFPITCEMVLQARARPSDSILRELEEMRLFPESFRSREELIFGSRGPVKERVAPSERCSFQSHLAFFNSVVTLARTDAEWLDAVDAVVEARRAFARTHEWDTLVDQIALHLRDALAD